MPVTMTARQLAFWRELLAPFRSDQLSTTIRGGKELTYIDKRSITNRLDSICGPHGWFPEYEATNRGYKCRLSILVPMEQPGVEVWMHKEDGAGFEEMGSKNKTTGEFEYDVDNDEKSGYTNAFRRAAQDAWGIGRYLYKKGIPDFLDPNATAGLPPIDNVSAAAPRPPAELADRQAAMPSTREPQAAPAARQPAPAANGQQYDNFKIPKPGKSVFAWCKEMEKTFQTKLFDGMASKGEEQGWGKQFGDWNEPQVNTVCISAITFLRELPTYKGQFEHLFPGGVPDAKIATTKGSGPNTPPPTPGVNVADLRKTLMTKMQALVTKQTGQPADNAGLKAVFQGVASSAVNGQGHTGEVPDSLSALTDVTWVNNMIALVDAQIAAFVEAAVASQDYDPTIPF
jgi:hypothetical protein